MTGRAEKLPRARRPCVECPWRQDVEPGQFPADRYDHLAATSAPFRPPPIDHTDPEAAIAQAAEITHAGLETPMFACHKSPEGAEYACAGWLASGAANDHLRIRLMLATGALPREAMRPGPDWPPLFDSYDEMAARQARRHDPSDGAQP